LYKSTATIEITFACGNCIAILVETNYYFINIWNALKLFKIEALSRFKLKLEKYSIDLVTDELDGKMSEYWVQGILLYIIVEV
jgi:hypothetical protein